MRIIGTDGRLVSFCGDDDTIDRRVSDRRVFDHITPERREDDRRAQPAPPVRPVTPETPRMCSRVSTRELNEKIEAFMERLLEAAAKRSLTDAEALAALSTEAGLKFAESQPCWTKEGDQCFQATAST